MLRTIRFIAVALIVLVVAGVAVYFSLPKPKESIEVGEGKVTNLRTVAQLCTVDIYNEVPVLDTINNKVIFAIQKQQGSISFDMEHLRVDTIGDTLHVKLPREIISIYEATAPNSWEVIDTKAIGPLALLHNGKLTAAEENVVKRRLQARSKARLYRNGTVSRARTEASATLAQLLSHMYRRPVVVSP